jgi:membrane fusion protein (multidrug efflux system)
VELLALGAGALAGALGALAAAELGAGPGAAGAGALEAAGAGALAAGAGALEGAGPVDPVEPGEPWPDAGAIAAAGAASAAQMTRAVNVVTYFMWFLLQIECGNRVRRPESVQPIAAKPIKAMTQVEASGIAAISVWSVAPVWFDGSTRAWTPK